MSTCLYKLLKYYLSDYINMRIVNDPRDKKKWYFKNGTVVHANTISSAEIKLINTSLNTHVYYSSEIDIGLWEVQFSNDIYPDVYVHVKADNGKTAAEYAKILLVQDKDNLEITGKFKSSLY